MLSDPKYFLRATSLMSALLLASACGDSNGGGDDPTPTPPASMDPSPTPLPDPPNAAVSLVELTTGNPVVGATVTLGEQSVVTDAEGRARLRVSFDTQVRLDVVAEGFRDYHLHTIFSVASSERSYLVASEASIGGLEAALGVEVDDGKGLLSVAVREGTPAASRGIPGMQVGLDASSDLSLAFDANAPLGFSPGNTVLPDSSSTIIFVNVDAGAVTPSFTHPSGYRCGIGPERLNVVAGAYTVVNYYCEREDNLQLRFDEQTSGAPVAGATVTVGEVSKQTDAEGRVSFKTELGAPWHVLLRAEGFRDHHIYNTASQGVQALRYTIASEQTLGAIGGALGLAVDDAKGLISVAAREGRPGETQNIADMTVSLDVDSDASLAFDTRAPLGFAPGATTQAGAPSTIIFVNAEPGDLAPSFTHPAEFSCELGPQPLPIEPGTYTIASYYCERGENVEIALIEQTTRAPVVGAEITVGEQTQTTDDAGSARFKTPLNEAWHAVVRAEGFRDYHLRNVASNAVETFTYAVGSEQTIAGLEQALGVDVDDSKGLLSVAVRRGMPGDDARFESMQVSLDASSDLSLVFDSASPMGFSPGNTTLEGSASTVIFVNVEAGDVTPSFAHDEAPDCAFGTTPIPIPAGTYTVSSHYCLPGE